MIIVVNPGFRCLPCVANRCEARFAVAALRAHFARRCPVVLSCAHFCSGLYLHRLAAPLIGGMVATILTSERPAGKHLIAERPGDDVQERESREIRGATQARSAALQAGEDRGSNVRSHADACGVGVNRRSLREAWLRRSGWFFVYLSEDLFRCWEKVRGSTRMQNRRSGPVCRCLTDAGQFQPGGKISTVTSPTGSFALAREWSPSGVQCRWGANRGGKIVKRS